MSTEITFDLKGYIAQQKSGVTGARGEGYAFAEDLKVLRTLRSLKPVELAVAQTVKLSKNFLKHEMLGNSVRVGPKQFPRLHRIAQECARTLRIAPPQVYLVGNVHQINAATYGTDDDAFIMVHGAAIDHLSDDELRFVIGHECGHIQNNHVVYLTTLYRLLQIAGAASAGLLTPFLQPLVLALQGWSRAAEITCDRAGLLCCRDPDVAVTAFAKLAIGSRKLFDEMNLDEFIAQMHEDHSDLGRMVELNKSHPHLTRRIAALKVFAGSAMYREAVGLAGGYGREELEKRTLDAVKVL